jgi:hypothetical protein
MGASTMTTLTLPSRPVKPTPARKSAPAQSSALDALDSAHARLEVIQAEHDAYAKGGDALEGERREFWREAVAPATKTLEDAELALLALMRSRKVTGVVRDGCLYLDLDEILAWDATGELRSIRVAFAYLEDLDLQDSADDTPADEDRSAWAEESGAEWERRQSCLHRVYQSARTVGLAGAALAVPVAYGSDLEVVDAFTRGWERGADELEVDLVTAAHETLPWDERADEAAAQDLYQAGLLPC